MPRPPSDSPADNDVLHIVSGETVAGSLLHSGTPSHNNLISWWDCLLLGPTPQTSSLEELSRIRTRYHSRPTPLSAIERAAPEEYRLPSLARRDRLLRRCSQWREVALWFGPAESEQLSLAQILATIAEQDMRNSKLTLVSCPKLGMGCYSPEELPAFFDSRSAVTKRQIALSARAWQLYCSDNPEPLFRFTIRVSDSSPLLSSALLLQLKEYPSIQNGLSAAEEKLLGELAALSSVVEAVGHVIASDPRPVLSATTCCLK
jgi:hypothetical protein